MIVYIKKNDMFNVCGLHCGCYTFRTWPMVISLIGNGDDTNTINLCSYRRIISDIGRNTIIEILSYHYITFLRILIFKKKLAICPNCLIYVPRKAQNVPRHDTKILLDYGSNHVDVSAVSKLVTTI
jgi:hypothetical protein